jgi:hypothetical protein
MKRTLLSLLLLVAAGCPQPPANGTQKCGPDPAHLCPDGYTCHYGYCFNNYPALGPDMAMGNIVLNGDAGADMSGGNTLLCHDGIKDGTETDVDCGGACSPCAVGKMCGLPTDCVTDLCTNQTCQGTCSDGIKDNNETDVDCGGGTCPACADGKMCLIGRDCKDKACPAGMCTAPSCTDGAQNGNETDIDCGGSCSPCGNGKGCIKGADCTSTVCSMGVCSAATCTDGTKNGTETDIDCGGNACPSCVNHKSCLVNTDCWSGTCDATMHCAGCPTTMAKVTAGSGYYCVDPQLASFQDYTNWLAQNPPLTSQPSGAICSWNTTLALASSDTNFAASHPLYPATVDWCDAQAYCLAHRKHLCGAIGGGSLAFNSSAATDATQSEWYNACSSGGANTYPYGNTYGPTTCDGHDNGGGTAYYVNVGSLTGCVTPTGIYDLSGNAYEWEDACNGTTGTNDLCHVRGGSYQSFSGDLACNAYLGPSGGVAVYDRGRSTIGNASAVAFRCCAGE